MRMLLAAAMLLILPLCPASAQDRPLLEPFRVGFARNEAIAGHMRATAALEGMLRRKGFLVTWLDFGSGLDAVRALDAERVDLALNVSLQDVIVARRENLKMIFIAELRSIAPTCCDLEQLYADHMFQRYTLSSEYFADQREDVLLIVHQQMTKALQRQRPEHLAAAQLNLGPIPVSMIDRRQAASEATVAPVTRSSMQESAAAAQLHETVDLADINYWLPQ